VRRETVRIPAPRARGPKISSVTLASAPSASADALGYRVRPDRDRYRHDPAGAVVEMEMVDGFVDHEALEGHIRGGGQAGVVYRLRDDPGLRHAVCGGECDAVAERPVPPRDSALPAEFGPGLRLFLDRCGDLGEVRSDLAGGVLPVGAAPGAGGDQVELAGGLGQLRDLGDLRERGGEDDFGAVGEPAAGATGFVVHGDGHRAPGRVEGVAVMVITGTAIGPAATVPRWPAGYRRRCIRSVSGRRGTVIMEVFKSGASSS
jgi:hypothetical protein